MQTDAMFWDRIARNYARRPIRDMSAYEATLDRTRHYLGRGDRALELGCGTGTTALFLAPAVAEYVATDLSAEMIAIGREKAAAEAADNIRFEAAGVTGAGGNETFDVVLAFNLLHLVGDLPAALAQVRARLHPGGFFVSKTPCFAHRKWLFGPMVAVMRALGKAPPVWFLSPQELERDIAAAGFEIVETGDYPAGSGIRFIAARKPQSPMRAGGDAAWDGTGPTAGFWR